jgi:predicted neutral ceramidase superfamily lipid hydrolase
MGNEIYKQHGFFYMCVCVNVVVHFVMGLVTMIHHKKYTCLQIIQFFSFMCTLAFCCVWNFVEAQY